MEKDPGSYLAHRLLEQQKGCKYNIAVCCISVIIYVRHEYIVVNASGRNWQVLKHAP